METNTDQPANTNLPAVIFETVLLDEKEPVKITADLIREKSKPLTDLVIENIFDQKGYDAVKSAKNKAVKTRTTIEKLEAAKNKELKADFDGKKKDVSDYTAELYAACKEVENNLQKKLTDIDTAKVAEVERLAKEKKDRTDGREKKMFELGLIWNGSTFSGLGKSFTKEILFEMSDTIYSDFVVELEGLHMTAGVTGKEFEQPATPEQAVPRTTGGFATSWPSHQPAVKEVTGPPAATGAQRLYGTAIYSRALPECGLRIVITDGIIQDPDGDAVVINDRILESQYYLQVVR